MEKELTNFERAIIEEIIDFNESRYPSLKEHIKYLEVKSRENTGIGMYVNFSYNSSNQVPDSIKIEEEHALLSSDRSLEVDTLHYGLNYVLNITKGKIDFLELVTNGEDWDGKYENFEFSNS